MTIAELGQLMKERRESFDLTVSQFRQIGNISENSLHNIELAVGRSRGDLVLQYLTLLGGVLNVGAVTIGSYQEFVTWYVTLRKSQKLSNYAISKRTGIGQSTLSKISANSRTRLNIDIMLTIILAYVSEISVLWISQPAPLLALQSPNDDMAERVGQLLYRARLNSNIAIFDMARLCNTREKVLLSMEQGEGKASLQLVLTYLSYVNHHLVIELGPDCVIINNEQQMRDWLSSRRCAINLSVTQLANSSRINNCVIRRYENGVTALLFYSCVKLIHALGGKLLIRE